MARRKRRKFGSIQELLSGKFQAHFTHPDGEADQERFLLEGGLSSQRYRKVHLTDDEGKKADHNIHILMARAFDDQIPGAGVTHLNGCKTDHRLSNLRPQISDLVLAQRAFQRKIAVEKRYRAEKARAEQEATSGDALYARERR